MFTFFRHRWDWLSLGVGFLLGLVFHVVLRLVQWGGRRLVEVWRRYREQRAASKEERIEQRYRRWLGSVLRGWHLAAPLFALDEILIPPAILLPPKFFVPEDQPYLDDIVTTTVPYSPEWPHLQAFYRAPTLTLPQALAGGAHLLLLGPPGMGKTTALLYLAWLLLRRDAALGPLAQRLPLYTHAADLALGGGEGDDLLKPLKRAFAVEMPAGLRELWERHLEEFLRAGRLVWLLDGLDELPLEAQRPIATYVARVLEAYPQVRVVAAAAPDFFDGFTRAGLVPVVLPPWNETQAYRFLVQWGQRWRQHIAPGLQAAPPEVDALLLNRWLLAERPVVTPLELTLHAWAAYAGDALGPRLRDALEAYLRRMLPDEERARPALQAAALELLNLAQAAVPSRRLGKHLDIEVEEPQESAEPGEVSDQSEEAQRSPAEEGTAQVPVKPSRVRRLLPRLLESGLLVERAEGRLGFAHPTLWAYLAGEAIAQWPADSVLSEPWWAVKIQALHFAVGFGGGERLVQTWLAESDEPLFRRVRWLGGALPALSSTSPVLPHIVRRLMDLLTDSLSPVGLRADALAALALSGEPGCSCVNC